MHMARPSLRRCADKTRLSICALLRRRLPTKVEIAEDPITALCDEDLDQLRTLLDPDIPPEEKVRAIKARTAVARVS
jgi:hypothetical protein